jgi:hypothetical protein
LGRIGHEPREKEDEKKAHEEHRRQGRSNP